MDVADPDILHLLFAPPPVARWRGKPYYNHKRCYMMNTDQLLIKLERVNVLADILTTLLVGYPQAQVLAELIMETSLPN